MRKAKPAEPAVSWTFLSNYAHVLIVLARQPDLRLRDVAARVGITERAVQRIVAELIADGFLAATRVGRCNTYTVNLKARLRHPIEAHRSIADLIALGS
jgi:DNA-binding IclR family transcriptional regulator